MISNECTATATAPTRLVDTLKTRMREVARTNIDKADREAERYKF